MHVCAARTKSRVRHACSKTFACRYASGNANGTFTLDLTLVGTALPAGDYRLCLCNQTTCNKTLGAKASYTLGVAYLTVVASNLPSTPGMADRAALSCSHIKAYLPGTPCNAIKC